MLDSQCNKVYLSDKLPLVAPISYRNLTDILNRFDVPWALLEGTKDVWCRDYMPVQVDTGCFASFSYNPDYLRNFKKYSDSMTDASQIMSALGLPCDELIRDIRLDGGNVVRCGSQVVMTAKVFEENSHIRPFDLLERLETAFDADILVLPWDIREIYGHSDGICRYVDDDTVLMTNYSQIDKKMGNRFFECLVQHFADVIELEYSPEARSKYDWAYINWLQTDKVLIVPGFGVECDMEALRQISAAMPSYRGRIVRCECPDLVRHGGALNCCSWTVME